MNHQPKASRFYRGNLRLLGSMVILSMMLFWAWPSATSEKVGDPRLLAEEAEMARSSRSTHFREGDSKGRGRVRRRFKSSVISRDPVGGGWEALVDRVPERYGGGEVKEVYLPGGGVEMKSVLDNDEITIGADLISANHDWGESRRQSFYRWLKAFRKRLCDEKITKAKITFEHEGEEMAIIGGGNLYAVLSPELWLQRAEEEFLEGYAIEIGGSWDKEALARGDAWLREAGMAVDVGRVRLGLTEEQEKALMEMPLQEVVGVLREDQLFRILWMSETFSQLILKEEDAQ